MMIYKEKIEENQNFLREACQAKTNSPGLLFSFFPSVAFLKSNNTNKIQDSLRIDNWVIVYRYWV